MHDAIRRLQVGSGYVGAVDRNGSVADGEAEIFTFQCFDGLAVLDVTGRDLLAGYDVVGQDFFEQVAVAGEFVGVDVLEGTVDRGEDGEWALALQVIG